MLARYLAVAVVAALLAGLLLPCGVAEYAIAALAALAPASAVLLVIAVIRTLGIGVLTVALAIVVGGIVGFAVLFTALVLAATRCWFGE